MEEIDERKNIGETKVDQKPGYSAAKEFFDHPEKRLETFLKGEPEGYFSSFTINPESAEEFKDDPEVMKLLQEEKNANTENQRRVLTGDAKEKYEQERKERLTKLFKLIEGRIEKKAIEIGKKSSPPFGPDIPKDKNEEKGEKNGTPTPETTVNEGEKEAPKPVSEKEAETDPEKKKTAAPALTPEALGVDDKLSDEEKARLAKEHRDFSFWGIVEQFASAKSPEEAFQGLLIKALLYLPDKAVYLVERKAALAKEKNKKLEEKIKQYDEMVAASKGLDAHGRLLSEHKYMIEYFKEIKALERGDAEGAARLCKEHPEFLKGIVDFDKDGKITGNLTGEKKEKLRKRMMDTGYNETYNHMPTQAESKRLVQGSKWLENNGFYEKAAEEKAVSQVPENSSEEDLGDFGKLQTAILSSVPKLRQNHPELFKDLGLKFNEDGTVVGEPTKEQMAELGKRIAKIDPKELGLEKEELSNIHNLAKFAKKNGLVEGEHQEVKTPEQDKTAAPVAAPVTEPKVTPPPVAQNQASQPTATPAHGVQAEVKRPEMSLQDARAMYFSMITPEIMGGEVNAFTAKIRELKEQQGKVNGTREALNQARRGPEKGSDQGKDQTIRLGMERAS